MNEVVRAAAVLQAAFLEEGWRFCFIGGLAVLRWGEPRETVDVDATVLTGLGHEEPFIDRLLRRFDSRIADAAAFARSRRVLLLRAPSGVGLDIALSGLPFEETLIERPRSSPFRQTPPSAPAPRRIWLSSKLSLRERRIGWTSTASSFGRRELLTGGTSSLRSDRSQN